MNATALQQYSTWFVPAFALVGGEAGDPDGPGTCEPLAVRWEERSWPAPAAGEVAVDRYACAMAHAGGAVDNSGVPLRASADRSGNATMADLFSGPGLVLATDQRLVGVLIDGRSVAGPVRSPGRLVFSLRYEDIEEIALVRVRKLTGVKDRALIVSLTDMGVLSLDLYRRVDDDRHAHKVRFDDVLRQLVQLVVARRWEHATPAERAVLDHTARGGFRSEGIDLVAAFTAG